MIFFNSYKITSLAMLSFYDRVAFFLQPGAMQEITTLLWGKCHLIKSFTDLVPFNKFLSWCIIFLIPCILFIYLITGIYFLS